MLGWQIFVHSVRMVFRNWRQALRIGLIPSTLIAMATSLFLSSTVTRTANQSWVEWIASMSSVDKIGFALIVVGNLIVILWIFVVWHRFVLLAEYPKGWIPPFNGKSIIGYLVRGIQVFAIAWLISWIVSFALLLVLVFLTTMNFAPRWLLSLPPLVGAFLSFFVTFRLGIVFPGTAVGQALSMKSAFQLTKGIPGSLLFLAVVQITGLILAEVIIGIAAYSLPLLSLGADVVFHLFFSLVHVSIWTTMYGVFVEKRELA